MPRAAPQVGDRRTVFSLLGKAGQQSPVERLSCELAAEALQVLLGDSVITLADSVVLRDWPVHNESLHRLPLASDPIPAGHPQADLGTEPSRTGTSPADASDSAGA
jgi:hypothetical protein